MAAAALAAMAAEPAVGLQDVFSATLADLLAILEKATSGETGIHASGSSFAGFYGWKRCQVEVVVT